MKTAFYIIAFCFCLRFNTKAQFNSAYQLDEAKMETIVTKNDCDGLKPVFYNFTRRRLYTGNKMPLNPRHFLELCRTINDPAIQEQIRRYDQLTRNKRKLIGALIFTGVAGYVTFIGSAIAASTSSGDGASIGMGIGAASMLIVTPALAISTTAPHQKRKEILFHDLPEAYNQYVTSQSTK
jgi:hypothetical protein